MTGLRIRNAASFFLLSSSVLLLSGCSDVDDYIDCLNDDKPAFDADDLSQPVLNQVFEATITVFIRNSLNDDKYNYDFTLTGDLPPGISYEVDDRDLNFTGTATSVGDYPYTLGVRVRDGYDDGTYGADASRLCKRTASRDFTMSVSPL